MPFGARTSKSKINRCCIVRDCRSVTKTETKILSVCGTELSLAGFDDLAKEAYVKMDDFANVMALYVKNQVSVTSRLESILERQDQTLKLLTKLMPYYLY